MRTGAIALIALMATISSAADKDAARYGVAVDLAAFPQGKPQEALTSVLKAVEQKRFDYLAAQLADPDFIDSRVKLFGGRFQEQVDDTRARLDPSTVKLLQRFLTEGDWKVADKEAIVLLKDVKDRTLFFRKIGERWFMENRTRAAK